MESYLEEWMAAVSSPIASLSRDHPDLSFEVRPVGFRWVVRCAGPSDSLDAFVASAAPRFSLLWVARPGDPLVTFAYPPGAPEVSLLRKIGSSGRLVLPPLAMRDGVTRFRALSPVSPSGAALPPTVPARLVSRRRLTGAKLREEVERLAPGRPGLTAQQSRVLLEAVRAGYYEVPRRVTVEDVARRLSLGRSTAEEHLRAAESAIVSRAAPMVELSGPEPRTADPPLEHVAGFSSELELYVDLALRGDHVANVRLLRSVPRSAVRAEHPHLHQVLEHLRTGEADLRDIAVDLRVSPFERQVLEEVRRIPSGETRTYSEIARRIGHPGASRAVGNAVAHNPVPLIVPCHRVVPLHGGIGNYSATGGTETKRRLLTREGALPRRSGGRSVRRRDGNRTAAMNEEGSEEVRSNDTDRTPASPSERPR